MDRNKLYHPAILAVDKKSKFDRKWRELCERITSERKKEKGTAK